MSKFNEVYLDLLRTQVEAEINYLMMHQHHLAEIQTPCMFCVDTHKGYYRCHRINDLKRFHSMIVVTQQSDKKCKVYHRRPIGHELPDAPQEISLSSELPLLYTEDL